MIKYDKLLAKMKEQGITSYSLKKDNIISQGVLTSIKQGKNIDMKSLNKFCMLLNAQPGDLLEYVPD